MIRAAFFDIDGTLLGLSTHEMGQKTRESLHALRRQGVKLFLSTGRSPSTAAIVQPRLDFSFDGLIAVNGQYCVAEGQVVRDAPIAPETASQTVALLTAMDVGCTVFELDRFFINIMNDNMRRVRSQLGSTASDVYREEAGDMTGKRIYQISPYFSLEEEKDFLVKMPRLRSVRWHPLFADLIPADGGKAVGVESVLRHYSFSREECIAFGDGGNDAEMLRYAGIGVAMAGGSEEALQSADLITDSAEEDGVANALYRLGIL